MFRRYQPLVQTTTYWLKVTAYLKYSLLSSMSGELSSIHNLTTCHAVVAGTHYTCNINNYFIIYSSHYNWMFYLMLYLSYKMPFFKISNKFKLAFI